MAPLAGEEKGEGKEEVREGGPHLQILWASI